MSESKTNFILEKIPFNLDNLRDRNKFNSCNHHDISPDDYWEKMEQTYVYNWIDAFKRSYIKITIDKANTTVLRKCFRIFTMLNHLSDIFKDDINDMVSKYDAILSTYNKTCGKTNIKTNDNIPEYFVRTDNVSLKYGIHGNIPHKSFRTIIESIVTCPPEHAPAYQGDMLDIYLFPWIEINPDLEFRVFVYNKKITAISQQFIYKKNNATADDILIYARTILDYFESTIVNSIKLDSYCFDICIVDAKPYFIEINPFGKEYSSGSALFHWLIDEKKLYNTDGKIYVRYTN